MRKWIGLFLVLVYCGAAQASIRHMDGVAFPTTSTLGGELIAGDIDWGEDNTISEADYELVFGLDAFAGTFELAANFQAGPSSQLIYTDDVNGLTLVAISADGPTSLNPATFVDTEGYGGWEAWTLTDTSPDENRYGTITSMTHVPEPGLLGMLCWIVAMFALRTHRR